jgi:hypothetical protein
VTVLADRPYERGIGVTGNFARQPGGRFTGNIAAGSVPP